MVEDFDIRQSGLAVRNYRLMVAEQKFRIGTPLLSADRHRAAVSAKNVLERFNLHVQRHSESTDCQLLDVGLYVTRIQLSLLLTLLLLKAFSTKISFYVLYLSLIHI